MFFTWYFLILLFMDGICVWLLPGSSILYLVIAILPGVAWFMDRIFTRREISPEVKRIFSHPVHQRHPFTVTLQITNPLPRDIHVRFQDEPPFEVVIQHGSVRGKVFIAAHSVIRISYEVLPPCRGRFAFGVVNLSLSGRLHLYKKVDRLSSCQKDLEVYPDFLPVEPGGCSSIVPSQFSGIHRQPLIQKTGEFTQIREYVQGDDFRKINWKVTAHTAKPVVNQYQPEKDQPVILVLDTGRLLFDSSDAKQSRLDKLLDAALLLAYTIMNYGDCVGALSFDAKIGHYLPLGKGHHHLQLLLQTFFDIKATLLESDYQEVFHFLRKTISKRSLIFLYTDISDAASSRELIDNLIQLRRYHRVVCVLLAKEAWENWKERPIESENDAYCKATALTLEAERESVKQRMRLEGIDILEVSASSIGRMVIEHYLYLKQGGLF